MKPITVTRDTLGRIISLINPDADIATMTDASSSDGVTAALEGIRIPVRFVDAAYTLTDADCVVVQTDNYDLTLPPAAGNYGRTFIITCDSNSYIDIIRDGTDTIDGQAQSFSLYYRDSVGLTSDGVSNWYVTIGLSSIRFASMVDEYASFTLAGSSGTEAVDNGDTLTVAAGTGVLSTPVTATDTVTVNTVWQRNTTTISPATAGDDISVTASGGTTAILGTSGTGLGVAGRSGSTGNGVDGRSGTIAGTLPVTPCGTMGAAETGHGVIGFSDAQHGVYGDGGGGNADYGIYAADCTGLGSYADLLDEASVSNPESGSVRIWAAADGMAYSQTSGGIIAALTSQGKETHYLSEGLDPGDPGASNGTPANDDDCNMNWSSDNIPAATTAATVTYTNNCTFTTPTTIGDVLALTDSYGKFSWTAVYDNRDPENVVYTQSYIVVGSPFQLFSGDAGTTKCKAARAYCRVRVANTTLFHSIKLVLSEASGANTANASLLGSMSNNTWYEGATAITDISSWTGPLRVTVVAYGVEMSTLTAAATAVDVEFVACEQYAN